LVLLQYHLGCRFSELSALRHEDVDLEAGIVRIRRGQYRGVRGRTKGRYARVAGLPLDVRVMLQKHIARVRAEGYPGADELVFPRPPYGRRKHSNHWSASTMHAILVRSYRRLGLRGPGVDNPLRGTSHVARHTVATIAEGLATASVLRKVLGQTQEIQRRYQHPEHAQVIELSERVAERLKRKGGEDV
jgi:integrase